MFSNSFKFSALPFEFTPTCEFVLRQLLNHDGMNKLSQLNLFSYMLHKVFIHSIRHVSHALRLA
jgi:hypothetical protein